MRRSSTGSRSTVPLVQTLKDTCGIYERLSNSSRREFVVRNSRCSGSVSRLIEISRTNILDDLSEPGGFSVTSFLTLVGTVYDADGDCCLGSGDRNAPLRRGLDDALDAITLGLLDAGRVLVFFSFWFNAKLCKSSSIRWKAWKVLLSRAPGSPPKLEGGIDPWKIEGPALS